MKNKQQIVTIDGPSGVGKSTVSKRVAAATGFTYLDTGAMYRGAGFFLQEQGVDLDDSKAIGNLLKEMDLQLVAADGKSDVGVIVAGNDISELVRRPEFAMLASRVSALPVVREFLTALQRGYGEKGNIVAEGRDTGTVVFPNAAYKFYLDAKPEERARRRVAQLKGKGIDEDYERILSMTLERDKNDSERAIAPLKRAEDAVYVETTDIVLDEVVASILKEIKSR